MLTAAELTALRAEFAGTFLNATATRQTLTQARTAAGGTTDSYVAGASFAARFEPDTSQSQEPERGGATRSVTTWRCWYDPTAVLTAGDRVTDGTRTFHVTGLLSPQTETIVNVAELELVA